MVLPVLSSTSAITPCNSTPPRAASMRTGMDVRNLRMTDFLIHTDDGIIRPGHAGIGLVSRSG